MQVHTLILCKLPSRAHFHAAYLLTENSHRKISRRRISAESNDLAKEEAVRIFENADKKWLCGWLLPHLENFSLVGLNVDEVKKAIEPIAEFQR